VSPAHQPFLGTQKERLGVVRHFPVPLRARERLFLDTDHSQSLQNVAVRIERVSGCPGSESFRSFCIVPSSARSKPVIFSDLPAEKGGGLFPVRLFWKWFFRPALSRSGSMSGSSPSSFSFGWIGDLKSEVLKIFSQETGPCAKKSGACRERIS